MSPAPKHAPVVSVDEQAKKQLAQTLGSLKAAYELENLSDFMQLLDKDYEGRLNFQSNLEKYFISNKNPQITIITDTVLVDKGKVSVRFHWFKKIIDNSGVFIKFQGSSQFVFKQNPEGLRLIYIRQDNPFF